MRRLLPRLLVPLALSLALSLAPTSLGAQDAGSLERFVDRVAGLWRAGDAGDIAGLLPSDGRLILDVDGRGAAPAQARHAAAALRELLGGRETLSVRTRRTALSGGDPPEGFGELTWVARPEGVVRPSGATVYVGAVWEGGAWRLRELRLVP